MVKFLVIRFSSIGDIVLTTPLLRCLKEQVEDAEICYLTKEQYAPILQENPHISRIFTLKSDFASLIRELRAEKFDYIIDLHHNLRSLRIKRALRLLSFSFNKLNWEKWLLVNFKKNRLPNIHIVERYLATLKTFSVQNDGKGLEYYLPAAEKLTLAEWIPENPVNYVVFVVGGGHYTKQIPAQQMIGLINGLRHDVILLGGKEDAAKSAEIMNGIQRNRVFSLVGKLSLHQSASIVQQSSLIITPDTGLMHIAAAFQKRIISVWGNTVPELGMYPYLPGEGSSIFEVKMLKCRPCSKIGFAQCPKKHFHCMQRQNYDALKDYAEQFLAQS